MYYGKKFLEALGFQIKNNTAEKAMRKRTIVLLEGEEDNFFIREANFSPREEADYRYIEYCRKAILKKMCLKA
jgi:hypothetical protein